MDLVVMAAGMGSRFGGMKQLAGVGPSGETIMDYAVYDAARAGVDRVVFVIRRELQWQFTEGTGQVIWAAQHLASGHSWPSTPTTSTGPRRSPA